MADRLTPIAWHCASGLTGSFRSSIASWLGELGRQLDPGVQVETGPAAAEACRSLGVLACAQGDRVLLGDVPPAWRERVLRHELVHLAQIGLARRGVPLANAAEVEAEADAIAAMPIARPARLGADPAAAHPFLPVLMAVGLGMYILLRPKPANVPGPRDPVLPAPSDAQIAGEAVVLFAFPGGAATLGGRIGLGFLGKSMLAGAATGVGLQGVADAGAGNVSSPLLYLFDATTGAAIGFVMPAGVRLIGQAGAVPLDRLATMGMTRSDIALTRMLAEEAAKAPLTATQAQGILAQRGAVGRVSQWYLNRRNLMVLYRGQDSDITPILSPLARTEGIAASEQLLARLRAAGWSDEEIATESAVHYDRALPANEPGGLGGLKPGMIGIPHTAIPGIAGGFGERGVIYVIRVPRSIVTKPVPWPGLAMEEERTIFNALPRGSIVRLIPGSRIPGLTIDKNALLAPTR